MTLTSEARQREMLALSFEPTEDGFIYYHYRWSRGIPVTPEEREKYLDIPVFGSRRRWRKALAGRESSPPRAYSPVAWKLMKKTPLRMAVFALVFGGFGLFAGTNEPNLVFATAYVVAGAATLFLGGLIIAARFRRSNADVR
jgi:hypothetical protein